MTVVGAAGTAAAYVSAGPARFWANWIVWTLFLLTIGLGNLFLVALERLVGAHWSVPMRRVPERIASLIPLAIPLLIIAFFGVPVLFPWTPRGRAQSHPGAEDALAEPALLRHSAGGLRPGVAAVLFLLRPRILAPR
jgi:hypothetical protein